MNRLLLSAVFCICALPVFTKTLFFQIDTVPPVVVCPMNDTVIIAPGPCTAPYPYDVIVSDDQPGVTLTQTSGLPSGADFPLGVTFNHFVATDVVGNTSGCSFLIRITRPFYTLSCFGFVEVQLDPLDCTATIKIEDLVEPHLLECPIEFSIFIASQSGTPHPNAFDQSDINTTFFVEITDTMTVSFPSCVTDVQIQDAVPALTCSDIVIPCVLSYEQHDPEYLFDSLGLANTYPQLDDACDGESQLSRVDQYFPGGCIDGLYEILVRTWKATDVHGQTATCSQHIEIQKVQLTQVVFPTDMEYPFPCKQTWQHWLLETAPFIEFQGKIFPLGTNSCNINAQYNDVIQILCPGKRQVARQFSITDLCNDIMVVDTQFILLPETAGPKVTCDSLRIVQTNASNCAITLNWLPVESSEFCSYTDGISVWWIDGADTVRLQGTIINGGPLQPDTTGLFEAYFPFAVGETVVTYEAVDACGNIGSCKQTIAVWDNAPPALVCNGNGTTVYLAGSGSRDLSASDWVQSTSDNCGEVFFKIKREAANCQSPATWNDVTSICCADIGDSVVFDIRAYDIPLQAGEIDETYGQGQYSSCRVNILVKDTSSLQCKAPLDTVVTCLDQEIYEYGAFTQSCITNNMVFENDFSEFDSLCKKGVVKRHLTVWGGGGTNKKCTQTITVIGAASYLAIRFPNDYYVTNCIQLGTPMDFGEPEIRTEGCSIIEVKMAEQAFPGSSSYCRLVERTWSIRDRCLSPMGNELLKSIPNPMPHSTTSNPLNMPGPVVSHVGAPDPWQATIIKISPNHAHFTPYSNFWSDSTPGYTYKQKIWLDDEQTIPNNEDCLADAVFVPDSTTNQPEFWNDSLIIVPSRNLPADRPDASFVLTARASDKCGFLNAEVYLHFDLTGNSGTESIVSSKQTNLPRGKMRINNGSIGNINSGPLMAFDKRQVPDSEKYRFVVKTFLIDSAQYIWEARVYWEGPNGTLVPPQLPHGYHRAEWIFTNPCSKTIKCNYNFSVRDGISPVLHCEDSLFLSLDLNAQAQIKFDDVLLSPAFDNLTPNNKITLSLNKNITANFPLDVFGKPVSLLEYNCWSPTFQKGQLWAKDSIGNTGFCTFVLKVQDTESYCNFGPTTLGGRIYTYGNRTMSFDEVYYDPQIPLIDVLDTTDANGRFQHAFNISGVRFDIQPRRNHGPANGVSTFDLVLINKHILNLETLDSPYKIIAADANGSRSVTTADIAVLRRIILGVQDTLPGQLSWRFVDSAYVFPNPFNPFADPIPFKVSVYNPPGNQLWHHFVGIKIGDVNDNADVDSLVQQTVDDRNPLPFTLQDRYMETNEIFYLHLAPQTDVTACQFTLNYPGLECLGITPDAGLTAEHAAVFAEKNKITVSNDVGGKTGFNLQMRALKNGFLSEKLNITSDITPAEAWTASGEKLTPQLVFRKNEATASLTAQPTVFSDQTVLSYTLPTETKATLLVYNAAGQLLFQQTVPGAAGEHQFVLNAAMVNHTVGALLVQLKTTAETLMVKLVRQ